MHLLHTTLSPATAQLRSSIQIIGCDAFLRRQTLRCWNIFWIDLCPIYRLFFFQCLYAILFEYHSFVIPIFYKRA